MYHSIDTQIVDCCGFYPCVCQGERFRGGGGKGGFNSKWCHCWVWYHLLLRLGPPGTLKIKENVKINILLQAAKDLVFGNCGVLQEINTTKVGWWKKVIPLSDIKSALLWALCRVMWKWQGWTLTQVKISQKQFLWREGDTWRPRYRLCKNQVEKSKNNYCREARRRPRTVPLLSLLLAIAASSMIASPASRCPTTALYVPRWTHLDGPFWLFHYLKSWHSML